jgi:hypothetical protein
MNRSNSFISQTVLNLSTYLTIHDQDIDSQYCNNLYFVRSVNTKREKKLYPLGEEIIWLV